MDIFLIRDAQESGPFSPETLREMLTDGSAAESDLAWSQGLSDWLPLGQLLAAQAPVTVEEKPSALEISAESERATAKQKALLTFFGLSLPASLTQSHATKLIDDATADPKNADRLALWSEERMRLHPELFSAEIQARKENRAQHFLERCQEKGTDYISGITKAHCEVLVGFLDVKFPHWDARDAEAAKHYFFPAVAEKFPQLVHKPWRGRLHYPGAMKVAAEIVDHSLASKSSRTATSSLVATVRGLVLGFVLLGVLYLGYRTMQPSVTAAPAAEVVQAAPATVGTSRAAPVEAKTLTPAPAPENFPPVVPPQERSLAAPTAPVAAESAMAPTAPAVAAPAADGAMAVAPMAPPPLVGTPAAAVDGSAMAITSSAILNAPMASLPGAEPPALVPPPPAAVPAAATLPTAPPEPVDPTPPAIPETAISSGAKTDLLLTKAVEIQLAYGKVRLPAGTALKLVSRQGATLKVSYRNGVISVPVTSTDLE